MHCVIAAVFAHQRGSFRMGRANAVTSAVHNHKNSCLSVLRNTERSSGLSARRNNFCRRSLLPVYQQFAAAAERRFNIVQIHRGSDAQFHIVAHLERTCRIIPVIPAHHNQVPVFRHLRQLAFLGNICDFIIFHNKLHQFRKPLVDFRRIRACLTVEVNRVDHGSHFIDRSQFKTGTVICKNRRHFEIVKKRVAVLILEKRRVLVFVMVQRGSGRNHVAIAHNRAKRRGMCTAQTEEIGIHARQRAVVRQQFFNGFFQAKAVGAFHLAEFQRTFRQINRQHMDILYPHICHTAVLFICHAARNRFCRFLFVICLCAECRCTQRRKHHHRRQNCTRRAFHSVSFHIHLSFF